MINKDDVKHQLKLYDSLFSKFIKPLENILRAYQKNVFEYPIKNGKSNNWHHQIQVIGNDILTLYQKHTPIYNATKYHKEMYDVIMLISNQYHVFGLMPDDILLNYFHYHMNQGFHIIDLIGIDNLIIQGILYQLFKSFNLRSVKGEKHV